jgi:hypothetical protein
LQGLLHDAGIHAQTIHVFQGLFEFVADGANNIYRIGAIAFDRQVWILAAATTMTNSPTRTVTRIQSTGGVQLG